MVAPHTFFSFQTVIHQISVCTEGRNRLNTTPDFIDNTMEKPYQNKKQQRDATAAVEGWTSQRRGQRFGVPLFNCSPNYVTVCFSFVSGSYY